MSHPAEIPEVDFTWPTLSGTTDPKAYHLHCVAHEYSLSGSILINDADDIQSASHWSERLEPFEHQVRNLITFCRRAPVALIADDVGLGKTISAGLVLSELLVRGRARKALVLAPKILLPQWHEELESKFGIQSTIATGADLDLELRRLRAPVLITTYDSARGRMDRIGERNFDMIILDEAHKLRNLHGGPKAPKMATALHQSLARRQFRYVLMLTATPIQNRLWDLYSLTDLLSTAKGHDHPLGSPERFVQRYVADGKTRARELVPGRTEEFRRKLAQYMVRTRRADAHLLFPSRQVKTLRATASDVDSALLRVVAREFPRVNPLVQISLGQAVMSSPVAIVGQLRRMVENGTAQPESLHAAKAATALGRPSKLSLLESLVDEMRQAHGDDWRLIIFTIRRETAQFLAEHFVDRGNVVGTILGGQAARNDKSIKQFWSEPPDVNLLISTDSGAEGINLQCCNTLVNYDLPWNPMVLEQRIGRIQRLASEHKYVQILNLVVGGTVEERVVARLIEKLQVIAETLGDIEGILEQTGELAGDDSFEAMIRKMVADSLHGIDTDTSVSKMEASIDRAKLLYEEEKEVVDSTLSGLDDMHRAGPSLPTLSTSEPSLSERDFTLGALEADGVEIIERGDEILARRGGGRPERVLFDDADLAAWEHRAGYFGGVPARLYVRGRPDFERLVGQWMRQHETLIRKTDPAQARDLVLEWAAGVDFDSADEPLLRDGRSDFVGRAVVKAEAAVALDRYEKILTVEITPPGSSPIEEGALPSANGNGIPVDSVSTASVFDQDQKRELAQTIAGDSDISGFQRYYAARLQEELEQAKEESKRQKLTQQFDPSVSAELLGLEGSLVSEIQATIAMRFNPGNIPWTAELTVAPSSAALSAAPAIGTCEQSERRIPHDLLGRCEFSGKRVFVGLLQESSFSGRRALAEHIVESRVSGRNMLADEIRKSALSSVVGHESELVQCSVSGDWMLVDEAGASDVSGAAARPDLLVASGKHPTRRGLSSETITCAETGVVLLSDEAGTSEASGKHVDKDLLQPSDESGRLALPEEMATCEVTGKQVLPKEVDQCAVSHRLVVNSALHTCSYTGKKVLPEYLTTCLEGEAVLASSARECVHTTKPVCPNHGVTLADDGAWIATRHATQCTVTGDWIRTSDAATSELTGKMARRSHVQDCEVSGATILRTEGEREPLFGAWISSELMDDFGLLKGTRDLLSSQGRSKGPACFDLEVEEHYILKGANFFHEVAVPGTDRARLIRVNRPRWLGFRSEDYLILAIHEGMDWVPAAVVGPGNVSGGRFTIDGKHFG